MAQPWADLAALTLKPEASTKVRPCLESGLHEAARTLQERHTPHVHGCSEWSVCRCGHCKTMAKPWADLAKTVHTEYKVS